MKMITHAAPAASCLTASGSGRSIAGKIAFGKCALDAALTNRARELAFDNCRTGRVHSLGTWRDSAARMRLSETLGPVFAPALRLDFEWYQCHGAHFHNDAHYDARLFGVWCVIGPPAALVFPRAATRLACRPGSVAIFDPFEVHGVLAPECNVYSESDYQNAEANVFLGFELEITAPVAAAFDIEPAVEGSVISSRTRIAADSGAILN